MMTMRHLAATAVIWAVGMAALAQQKLETTVATDVVSQYVWRGQDLGSLSVQPVLGIAYKGFELAACGSVGIADTDDDTEIDITASFTTGAWNFCITDYWTDSPEARYFLYDAHRTNHLFEAGAGYDFGLFSLQWYTNFAGNDGETASGRRAYSSYLEASAPFQLGGCQWKAVAGVVPFATTYYETSGLAVTNLSLTATKEIALSQSFSLPVFAQLTANPCTQRAFLVVGVTLSGD